MKVLENFGNLDRNLENCRLQNDPGRSASLEIGSAPSTTALARCKWGVVYLDNAKPRDMSQASFRSYLATLSGAGLYKVQDGYAWGLVRIAVE